MGLKNKSTCCPMNLHLSFKNASQVHDQSINEAKMNKSQKPLGLIQFSLLNRTTKGILTQTLPQAGSFSSFTKVQIIRNFMDQRDFMVYKKEYEPLVLSLHIHAVQTFTKYFILIRYD